MWSRSSSARAGRSMEEITAVQQGERVPEVAARRSARADFEMEAAGLRWLAEADGIRVPEVRGRRRRSRLARARADRDRPPLRRRRRGARPRRSPRCTRSARQVVRFAAARALRTASCASASPSSSSPSPSAGPRLYAEQMLAAAGAREPREAGLSRRRSLERSRPCASGSRRLAGPDEPPARLHGDLWSGNVLAGTDGRAWLIDPAAYGGHREVDLAMLRLFGSPSERIFEAYEEAAPLADGHADRVDLWQLQPLLVHALLFGGSYGASAARADAASGSATLWVRRLGKLSPRPSSPGARPGGSCRGGGLSGRRP